MTASEPEETIEVTIKGWFLNYLFRDDKMTGTVTITPYEYEEANQAVYKFLGSIFDPPGAGLQFSTITRYSAAANSNEAGYIVFQKGFDTILIDEAKNKKRFYAASDKPLEEVNDRIELFRKFIEK